VVLLSYLIYDIHLRVTTSHHLPFITHLINFFIEIIYFLVLALSGLAIGSVGGMVGLVLGVVRFPVVMSVETSISITAGTNLGVSTLGAIAAAIRHYHQKNIEFRAFVFLATTVLQKHLLAHFLQVMFLSLFCL
jgi:uncharacterized membrane protein YfcA